jgi:hypothetical protein
MTRLSLVKIKPCANTLEKKPDLPKDSILVPIVALWAKGSSQQTVHKPAPHGNTEENQPAADGPSYQDYDLGSHTIS